MYLKTLAQIHGERGVARVKDLALGLGVSPASVSTVLKKLERQELVEHERYGFVALTRSGRRVADCVQRRFETLAAVLVEVFGVAPDVAAVDACMMEHAVSPATIRRMQRMLESVRRGRVRLPARRAPAGRDGCEDCEALGDCQASVAPERIGRSKSE